MKRSSDVGAGRVAAPVVDSGSVRARIRTVCRSLGHALVVLAAVLAVTAGAVTASAPASADAPSITGSWAEDDRTVQLRVHSAAMGQDIMVKVLRP
ncbi:hypothetical protein ACW9HS_37015, partial [Nocardia gipuzkoensis]